jgi:hypothetical protein
MAAPALAHGRQEMIGHLGQRAHVDIDDAELAFGRKLVEVADGAEAGVVDEDVDSDALGDGALLQLPRRLRIGEIGRPDSHGDAVLCAQRIGQLPHDIGAPRDQDEIVAVGGEQLCQLQSDAGGSAGDEGGVLPAQEPVTLARAAIACLARIYSAALDRSAAEPRRM